MLLWLATACVGGPSKDRGDDSATPPTDAASCARMELGAGPLDLGEVASGESVEGVVTLTNTGAETLGIGTVAVSAEPAGYSVA